MSVEDHEEVILQEAGRRVEPFLTPLAARYYLVQKGEVIVGEGDVLIAAPDISELSLSALSIAQGAGPRLLSEVYEAALNGKPPVILNLIRDFALCIDDHYQ